jgi:hypothetical protein
MFGSVPYDERFDDKEFYDKINSNQITGYLTVSCIALALGCAEIAAGIAAGVCVHDPVIGAWWGSVAVAIGGALGIASVAQGHAQRRICLAATISAGVGFCSALAGVVIDCLVYRYAIGYYNNSASCRNTLLSSAVVGSFSLAITLALFIYSIYVLMEPPEDWEWKHPYTADSELQLPYADPYAVHLKR